MADLNYNPAIQRPQTDVPGLAGMWAMRDRGMYDQQSQLQQLMDVNKFSDYMQDAPVRQTKRLSDIATNQAEAETVMGRKRAEVEQTTLANDYNRQTLQARVGQGIAEAGLKEQEAGLQKIQQGLSYSAMMMQAMGQYGPAGAAQVLQQLRARGINVENDPVVQYVMSAGDAQQMKGRIEEVFQAFNHANQTYRTELMKANKQKEIETLKADRALEAARIKTGAEKEHDESIKAFEAELKQQHPNWTPAQIKAEAVRQYQAGRYGVQRQETTADRERAKYSETRKHLYRLTQGKFGDKPGEDVLPGALPYKQALDFLRANPTPANKSFFKRTYDVDPDVALNYKEGQ